MGYFASTSPSGIALIFGRCPGAGRRDGRQIDAEVFQTQRIAEPLLAAPRGARLEMIWIVGAVNWRYGRRIDCRQRQCLLFSQDFPLTSPPKKMAGNAPAITRANGV